MLKIMLIVPFLIIGFLYWIGVPYMIWAFIVVVGLHYAGTAILHPAWVSWMGSIVPEDRRGDFFSKRKRAIGVFGVITMIVGAIFIDSFKRIGVSHGDILGFTLMGFGALFLFSGVARFFSWITVKQEYEPIIKIRKKDYFSLRNFLQHRNTPFGRFSLFVGMFTFVIGIAAPYWSVYMLRNLNFSYTWYMLIGVSSLLFQIIFLPLLGKFSDRFGNIKLMKTCSIVIGAVPFLWIASSLIKNILFVKIYLLLIPAIVGGFGWAGYNLAISNYIYDAVSSRRRSFGLSYMNLMIGVGGFLGAIFGSLIAWMNISFINPILFIFAISGLGRIGMGIFSSKFLREVKNVKKFSPQFWVQEFIPMREVVKEIHILEHITDEIEYYVSPREKEAFARSERLKPKIGRFK